jgi:P-type Cu2+ transporter
MAELRDLSHFVRHLDNGGAAMDLAVEGIRCAGCMTTIENGLARHAGVIGARVNLALKRVTVEWNEAATGPEAVLDRLHALGFKAYPFSPVATDTAEAREERRLLRCLAVAGFAAMNIMLLSVSVWAGTDMGPEVRDLFHWLSALIALPAAAYSGRPFFESAMRALRQRSVNMDVPITLGVLLALGMSVVETWNHGEHAYFDGALMLIFFLLIGRGLDLAMRRRTRDLAGNLAALKAETANKRVSATETITVPLAAIQPGDVVLVRPGERVSVDGLVTEGTSDVDQSLITGETAHARVIAGDRVHAGTVNITGLLTVRATAAESGTLLDEINRLMLRAVESKSQYVALADRAARLYAPMVHATALLTFLGWLLAGLAWQQALVIAITVLIITCPCALGLAVPAAQVVAANALFRRSVLLNEGAALERLAEADTVVFDKTGTLTMPSPEILNSGMIRSCDLAAAGMLAAASRHPLAAALARAAEQTAPAPGVTEVPGEGVRCVIDGVEARLGSPAFCDAQAEADRLAVLFPAASFIAWRQGERSAVFAMGQALRPDAEATIAAIRAMGIDIEIVSGDRAPAVDAVSKRLGISRHASGQTPADKIARLKELSDQGRKVLMVGDGLNDAPALAAASVSLSPVSATHLAQAAADAVFLGDSLRPVADALRIARKARRVMMQNLWLAVVYNFIAVPVAIAGWATPLVAAAAMSGSSVLVSLNALRARAGAARLGEDRP